MKRIKEFITFEKGFFSQMAKDKPELYTELFEDVPAANMDMDLIVTCGERYAAPLLIHYDMSKVVDYVLNRYCDGWKRVKNALNEDYNVLTPYDNKRVTTQEKTGTNTTSGTVSDKTGVTTFDSDEAVDKTIESTVNEGTTNATEKVTITVENTGTNGNMAISNLIQNEIEVRKNSFIALVIGDVENQLSLDIY